MSNFDTMARMTETFETVTGLDTHTCQQAIRAMLKTGLIDLDGVTGMWTIAAGVPEIDADLVETIVRNGLEQGIIH